jgi:hypothetical protein
MKPHEKYELLCALAATRQLDGEDKRNLDLHLQECADCRTVMQEFKEVVQDLTGEGIHPDTLMNLEGERRQSSHFVDYARSKGIRISDDARLLLDGRTIQRWRFPKVAYVTAFGLMFIFSAAFFLRPNPSLKQAQVPQITHVLPAMPQTPTVDAHQEQIAKLKSELEGALTQTKEIPQLKGKIVQEEKANIDLSARLVERDARIEEMRAAATETQKQLATAQTTVASLTDKNDQVFAELLAERIRSKNLSEDLSNEKASMNQERELSAATKEVRGLMGARRLYMVDVYDGDDPSHANRSFGRVFYTEGKSLIFYAFDLDKIKSSKHITFQAWGERGKDPGSVKHLGDFYIDDVAQKRWVMKVNDPERLKNIDAIFVTVESGKSTGKPTGNKLLYAYLGGQPNHP